MKAKRLILAGGSGFLGRSLAHWFSRRGWEVIVLSRDPAASIEGAATVPWDGRTRGGWTEVLDGATALVNLAGRSVNCRYSRRNRRRIRDSRVESTRVLGEAIARCGAPPRVWINSSTATIYRHTTGPAHPESSTDFGATAEARDAFSIEVARAWEGAFHAAYAEHGLAWTRPVLVRTAMVFGAEPGGVWHTLRRLVRLGLGGRMGHGRQFVSWIHGDDFCRAIEWLLEDEPDRSGVYNLAAPAPLTNAAMMTILRRELARPLGLPAPRWLLELGALLLRTETELIVKSRRVVPARLEAEGFEFHVRDFRALARDLEWQRAQARREAVAPPAEADHGCGLRSPWVEVPRPAATRNRRSTLPQRATWARGARFTRTNRVQR